MSKHKVEEPMKKEISLKQKHPTAVPRLEGKVKNRGIKPVKKKKKEKKL